MAYYNTTELAQKELHDRLRDCKKQQAVIIHIFRLHSQKKFTPSNIWQIAEMHGNLWPLTSIRRAITDLTAAGILIKTEEYRTGVYRHREHVWVLAKKEAQ